MMFPENCQTKFLTLSSEGYEKNTPNFFEDIWAGQQAQVDSDTMVVQFGHESSTIERASLVRRDDLNDVVSNLGGGLGLYLGFSIISTLIWIYDCIFSSCCNRK